MPFDHLSLVLIVIVINSGIVVLPSIFLLLFWLVVGDHDGRRLDTDVHDIVVRDRLGLLLVLKGRPWRFLWTQSDVLFGAVFDLEL